MLLRLGLLYRAFGHKLWFVEPYVIATLDHNWCCGNDLWRKVFPFFGHWQTQGNRCQMMLDGICTSGAWPG